MDPSVLLLAAVLRLEPGALPRHAQPEQITELLVGAHWFYPNPHKMTSTWDSQAWAFRADGTVEITTHDVMGPQRRVEPWRVVRGGARPIIAVRKSRYTLRTCAGDAPRKLCLYGPER